MSAIFQIQHGNSGNGCPKRGRIPAAGLVAGVPKLGSKIEIRASGQFPVVSFGHPVRWESYCVADLAKKKEWGDRGVGTDKNFVNRATDAASA